MYTHCARLEQTNKQIKQKFNDNRLVPQFSCCRNKSVNVGPASNNTRVYNQLNVYFQNRHVLFETN